MKVSASIAAMVLLFAAMVAAILTPTSARGLITAEHVLSQAGPPQSGGGKDCCSRCPCTRSIPPQCRCLDVSSSCFKGCKLCVCNLSFPPQCQCLDIMSSCPNLCYDADDLRLPTAAQY